MWRHLYQSLIALNLMGALSLALAPVGVAVGALPGVWAQPAPKTVSVSGTLIARAFVDDINITEVEIPDAEVTLKTRDGAVIDTDTTMLDGRFRFRAPPDFTYVICWEVQGESGCSKAVQVGQAAVWADRVVARIEAPHVYGTVLTGDLRPCWVHDSFFNLDVSTEVRGGGQTTRANTQGEYLLIVPAGATLRVSAECERAEAGQVVTMNTSRKRLDLNFGNRAPRITSIAATDGTRFKTRAQPGETLTVVSTNRELDNDTVEYMWKLPDGQPGALSGSLIESEEWRLPNANGRQSLYVMARDGRGGFAFTRFDLQVGEDVIDASGIAVDEVTGLPIPNATVTLGSESVRTDGNGWFAMTVKPEQDERYVLNIAHPNYATLSRILDRSAYGGTYQMVRAQVTTHAGDKAISIEDTRSSGACGALPEGRTKPVRRLAQTRFVYDETADDRAIDVDRRLEDERAILEYVNNQRRCDPRGVRISLPANSLVDADGNPWTGLVRASVATLNPERRSIPGDYQAIDANGERMELLSFGAFYAEFTDLNGRPLQLRQGATAEIATPLTPLQRNVAGGSIAQWSYDEETGFWREEGKASLQPTSDGMRYVGTIEHFSTINMDVAGNDPAVATCVRVEIDAAFSAWSNLVLRSYVSYNGDSVQVKETSLDNDQYHAIYRIPFGNNFPPNTLRLELRGTLSGEEVLLLDNIINTDARPKMTGNDLWPPYPYTECGDPILLTTEPGVVPAYGDFDATGRPSFLIGPYGAFNPVDGGQQAIDYYNALDPGGVKTNLGDWWAQNGFDATSGSGGVRQAYLNHNDLGFGRDMHCLETGSDLACYVTNYGLPDQNPNNADAAENQDPAQRGATVSMEYDASAPVAERVQFFVFGGGDAAAPRITFADLDGLGPKPVPFLCSVCHGGDAQLNANGTVDHARFREFDLPSFRYSGNRSWGFGDTSLNATELANFADLNEMVLNTTGGQPIGDLINEWYPSGFVGGPPPVLPDPPSGWAANPTEYHEVYGQTCRTCHIARDEGNPNAFFVFNDFAALTGTSYSVCGSGVPKRRFMPNAVVTYKNFWADTPRVQIYETMTGEAIGSCND